MGELKKIKTSVYLPETVHWGLKEESVRRRMTDTAAMEQAITRWIEAPEASNSNTPKVHHDRWHQMLDDIMASGDREAISAVQQNLLVFHRVKIGNKEIHPADVKKKALK